MRLDVLGASSAKAKSSSLVFFEAGLAVRQAFLCKQGPLCLWCVFSKSKFFYSCLLGGVLLDLRLVLLFFILPLQTRKDKMEILGVSGDYKLPRASISPVFFIDGSPLPRIIPGIWQLMEPDQDPLGRSERWASQDLKETGALLDHQEGLGCRALEDTREKKETK
ncbi:Ubiquitin carboxyl-terminal hydrolase 21, partial [Manis javanica]